VFYRWACFGRRILAPDRCASHARVRKKKKKKKKKKKPPSTSKSRVYHSAATNTHRCAALFQIHVPTAAEVTLLIVSLCLFRALRSRRTIFVAQALECVNFGHLSFIRDNSGTRQQRARCPADTQRQRNAATRNAKRDCDEMTTDDASSPTHHAASLLHGGACVAVKRALRRRWRRAHSRTTHAGACRRRRVRLRSNSVPYKIVDISVS
jgi:hypothetical protein